METLKNTVSALAGWHAISPLADMMIGIGLFLVLMLMARRHFGATIKLLLILGLLGALGIFAWQLASIGLEKKGTLLEKPALPNELTIEMK